jgi:hypothetical protein
MLTIRTRAYKSVIKPFIRPKYLANLNNFIFCKKIPILLFFVFFVVVPAFASTQIASKLYVDHVVANIPSGPKGDKGDDGREVEFQANGSHIQWRYSGESSWRNLVALSALGTGYPVSAGIYLINVDNTGATAWKKIEIKDVYNE